MNDLRGFMRQKAPAPIAVVRKAIRLCAFCVEDARTEVEFGSLKFAICAECAWHLTGALEKVTDDR